jgi:hypothetical protein
VPSYYEVLGVPPDADREAIRTAYAAAVRASPTARTNPTPRDRKLDEAYAVLGDPGRRVRYDDLRADPTRRGTAELVVLLSVIADTGGIPNAVDVLGPSHPATLTPSSPAPTAAPPPHPTTAVPPSPQPPVAATADTAPPPVAHPAPAEHPVPAEPAVPAEHPVQPGRSAADQQAPSAAEPESGPAAPAPRTADDPRRLGRARTTVGVLLLAAVVGAVTGIGLSGEDPPAASFEQGGCVALGEEQGTAVPCDDPRANTRVTELTTDPRGCADAPLGHLELPSGQLACLVPLDEAQEG